MPCHDPTFLEAFLMGGHQAGEPAARLVVIPVVLWGVWAQVAILPSRQHLPLRSPLFWVAPQTGMVRLLGPSIRASHDVIRFAWSVIDLWRGGSSETKALVVAGNPQ